MDLASFKQLTYGVFVVASGDNTKKGAYICTVAVQITSRPYKLAIACNKNNYTAEIIQEKKNFSVSILKQNYAPTTMGNFGFRTGKDFNKFEKADFIYGQETGCPIILTDTMAWFECQLEQTVDAGSHYLFIGNVLQCEIVNNEDVPLTYQYYQDVKKGVSHKNAPSFNK